MLAFWLYVTFPPWPPIWPWMTMYKVIKVTNCSADQQLIHNFPFLLYSNHIISLAFLQRFQNTIKQCDGRTDGQKCHSIHWCTVMHSKHISLITIQNLKNNNTGDSNTMPTTPLNKKLSCHRETAWCFVLLNILLSHSKVTQDHSKWYPWVGHV